MPYPVVFDVDRPPSFKRVHVLLRIAMLIVLGWISHPFGLLWLGIPVVVAILVSQKDGRRYLDENGPTVTRVLGWFVGALAYLALLTDRFPGGGGEKVRFEVQRTSSPTVGSALLRIVYAIPSLIALAIISLVGVFTWVIAVVFVLVHERYPEGIWRFQYGIVRWAACLFAYLASLVDRYPPWTLQLDSPASSPAVPSS
jgi:Domain of unknown function (DUF4389)